jgi:hypothetical protein
MTNAQLYIAVGVPVLALLFAMVTNFALIARVDKRIDEMGARIDEMSSRFDRRIDDLRDVLRAEMQRDHSEIMAKFADVERRLERLEGERRVIQ